MVDEGSLGEHFELDISALNSPEPNGNDYLCCILEFVLIKMKNPIGYCANNLLEYHLE